MRGFVGDFFTNSFFKRGWVIPPFWLVIILKADTGDLFHIAHCMTYSILFAVFFLVSLLHHCVTHYALYYGLHSLIVIIGCMNRMIIRDCCHFSTPDQGTSLHISYRTAVQVWADYHLSFTSGWLLKLD